MGDQGLSTLESRFPIVKEDTATIQGKCQRVVSIPFRAAQQGRELVWKTYEKEYESAPKYPVVRQVAAVVGTEIKLTTFAISYVIGRVDEQWNGLKAKKQAKMGDKGEVQGKN
jgi:hypothetical protein